ncbi:unnamed protein product, partial [Ilex paraguariensis]
VNEVVDFDGDVMVNQKSGMLNSPIYIEEQPELVRSGASQATQVNVVPKNQVFSKVDVMTETMHVELERNLNEVVAEVKALNNEEVISSSPIILLNNNADVVINKENECIDIEILGAMDSSIMKCERENNV